MAENHTRGTQHAVIPGYLAGALRDRPAISPYQWRTRAYPHAARAIRLAEAEHGPPLPTCLPCGGRVSFANGPGYGKCTVCGRPAADDVAAAHGMRPAIRSDAAAAGR